MLAGWTGLPALTVAHLQARGRFVERE